MNRQTFTSRFFFVLMMSFISALATWAQILPSERWVANELLVKLAPGIDATGEDKVILDLLSATNISTIYGTDVQVWQIPDLLIIGGRSLHNPEELSDYFRNNPHPYVEYVEPNYRMSLNITPNDPMFGSLWGMQNIQAAQSWDIKTDCNNVVVGVLDTGIDWTHPDLINNIWQNLGEDADGDGHVLEYINGVWQFDPGDINGIDNDGNGFADDFIGWDFVNNDNNPMDDHSHGTHCAGTIGARGNNGLGVTGVCWQIKLMALKFMGASGGGSSSAAIAALNYATNKGVKITSNSWGGGNYSQSLYNTILNAQNNNALFVAAAGNSGNNNDVDPHYPSSYTLPNIISVAASTPGDVLTSFSCYGATSVDLAAPGIAIRSTIPGNNYGYKSGTSMAAPHVAGAAALVYCPSMGYADIKSAILSQVDAVPSLAGKCVTGGRLNVFKALSSANCCNALAGFSLPPTPYCAGKPINFVNTSTNANSYQWKINNVLQGTSAEFTYTFAGVGTYAVTLIAANSTCSHSMTQHVTIVSPPSANFTYVADGLTVNFNGIAGASYYNWIFGDGNNGNGNVVSHSYSLPGTYNVCLSTNNGCNSNFQCNIESEGGTLSTFLNQPTTFNVIADYTLNETLISVLQPTNGSVTWTESGNITYTPNIGFIGVEMIVFQIQNQYGYATTGTASVQVYATPLPLNLTWNASCNENNLEYAVCVNINGGTPPFIISGNYSGTVLYSSTSFNFTRSYGTPFNITVVDATGTVRVLNENPEVCNTICQTVTLSNTPCGTSSEVWTNYTNGSEVLSIAEEGNVIWVGTSTGLIKFNKLTQSSMKYTKSNSELPDNRIQSVAIDLDGNKWFGCESGGLIKYDNNIWQTYNMSNSGLPNNNVTCISIDSENNKWVATYGGGLAKFTGSTWTTYKTNNSGIPHNNVNVVVLSGNGDKWVGTDAGAAKFSGSSWTVYKTNNSGLVNNTVIAIAIASNGDKWLGTHGGISKFTNTNWTNYTNTNSNLPGNEVLSISIDMNGDKWIGVYGYGLCKFNGFEWVNYNMINSNLTDNRVSSIYMGANNALWLGTLGGGLNYLGNGLWLSYNWDAKYISSNRTYDIYIDHEDNKWFGTWGGLTRYNGSSWTHYDINSGLQAHWVRSIGVDNEGIAWIGATDGGLLKFDGINWTNYTTANSGLPFNGVEAIAFDSNNNKWIGTLGTGTAGALVKFDGQNWTTYNISNSGLPAAGIWALAIDENDDKWIGTGGGALAKLSGDTWTLYSNVNSVLSIAFAANGVKWFGTWFNGIYMYNGTTWVNYNTSNSPLPNNRVWDVEIDASGNIWIATSNGLCKFTGSEWTVYNSQNSILPDNGVNSLGIDSQNNIWVGTWSAGVVVISEPNSEVGEWVIYNTSNSGIPQNYTSALSIDNTGIKWVGTNGGEYSGNGMAKFDDINWQTYNISNSALPSNSIYAIVTDSENNKWLGGFGGGLAKFSGTSWTIYNTSNSPMPWNYVYSLAIDNQNNKWIGTSSGLAKFSGTAWNVYKTNNSGIPSNFILALYPDNENNIWIGTHLGGLAKFNGVSWTTYNTSNSGLPSNDVSSIFVDNEGNKWVGTGAGLVKFNGTAWVTYNVSNSDIPSNDVRDITQDNIGNLWLATHGGLAKFDGTNWITYNTSNSNLPSNIVCSIEIDNNNNKWLCTQGGLVKLNTCANSCSANPSFIVPTSMCPQVNTVFTNTSTNATSYQWYVNGISVGVSQHLTYTFPAAGNYIVKLAAFNGTCFNEYTQTVVVSNNCVWPGDANADGAVNMLDWLAVGLAYNKTGPPRSNQNIDFSPKYADDFTTSFTGDLFTGINHKHADCNGNGIVNATDTIAIVQNFGQSYSMNTNAAFVFDTFPEALLSSEANTPVVALNNNAFVDITLENAVNGGAVNCYGLAFTLQYEGVNPRLHFEGSCFGLPGIDFIASYKVNVASKLLYVGITRINNTNVAANGKIATLEVVIDALPPSGMTLFSMPITGAAVIDNSGYHIPTGGGDIATLQVFEYLSQEQAPLLNAKVFLQGALSGEISIGTPTMRTVLRNSNLIPLQQPYNAFPWNYSGTESAGAVNNLPTNAVDWVLLELRHQSTYALIWRKAAILLNDGSIQDAVNPISGRVRLESSQTGSMVPTNQSYYLIVRHRNHLDVVSSTPLPIIGNVMNCNFTMQANQVMGNNQLVYNGGIFALKAGDLNADGILNYTDFNTFISAINLSNQYHKNDCNLDGNVSVEDYGTFAPNLGSIGVNLVRY